jgi:hydrogenase-1 operon protein HyaF
MKDFPIPVRPIGPGSQPGEGEFFNYVPIPREVQTFAMPSLPEDAEAAAMAGAHAVLAQFLEQMASGEARIDLAGVDPAALTVLNQSLGEGEVAARISAGASGTREIRIQETVFAGVWRERHYGADGTVQLDLLEAASIPPIAIDVAQRSAAAALAPHVEIPDGAMNAPALLTEIREQTRAFRPGRGAHVLNLTLLPLTPADHALLERAVPPGPVAILSRGFGNCRITSTQVRNVWRVQYFNNMQTLILNTLEIVRVPEVALAADEDLADSRERLGDLLQWMAESAG